MQYLADRRHGTPSSPYAGTSVIPSFRSRRTRTPIRFRILHSLPSLPTKENWPFRIRVSGASEMERMIARPETSPRCGASPWPSCQQRQTVKRHIFLPDHHRGQQPRRRPPLLQDDDAYALHSTGAGHHCAFAVLATRRCTDQDPCHCYSNRSACILF